MSVENDEPPPEKIPLPEPRPVTEKEGALINFVLAGPFGSEELRRQVETAQVVGVCSCGCPSVYLEVDPSAPVAQFNPATAPFGRTGHVPLTAVQRKSRGSTEVTLHVVNGRIEELEIWAGFGVRPRVDLAKLEYEDWSSSPKLDWTGNP